MAVAGRRRRTTEEAFAFGFSVLCAVFSVELLLAASGRARTPLRFGFLFLAVFVSVGAKILFETNTFAVVVWCVRRRRLQWFVL